MVKNAQAKAKVLLTTFPAWKLLPKQLICITFYADFESGKTVPHCLENAIFTPQPTSEHSSAPVWEHEFKRQMEDAEEVVFPLDRQKVFHRHRVADRPSVVIAFRPIRHQSLHNLAETNLLRETEPVC